MAAFNFVCLYLLLVELSVRKTRKTLTNYDSYAGQADEGDLQRNTG